MENTDKALPAIKTQRDGKNTSIWQSNISKDFSGSSFSETEIYDILIVGGGITGITTALLLQQQGKKCILAEAVNMGYGTTGGTTAHLNTFFDATYPEVESDFGEDAARLLADAGKEALEQIRNFAKTFEIECDLEFKEADLFSQDEKESKELDEILASSQKAGIDVKEANDLQIPIPFEKVIRFEGQGQFHPLKYITGLAEEFKALGGVIAEHTFIKKTSSENDYQLAETEQGSIKAKNIVYATHIPPGVNVLHLRNAPYRSYVLGIRLQDEKYPERLIYDMKEPYHYFRTHIIDNKKYLILGGEDHKTGHDDPEKAFEQLEAYARNYFKIDSIDYKWSSQYYQPADGLPYIGELPGFDKNVYAATGYNGNGMILGTLSGMIISDLITGKENRYADLFKPSRIKPVAGFLDFVKENADVAYHFIADRFSSPNSDSLNQLPSDSGEIIKLNGEQVAVYKDNDGNLHALNAVCTHTGCIVNWNNTEKSWDCPCHGGRFNKDGKVLTGPPRIDLQKIEIQSN